MSEMEVIIGVGIVILIAVIFGLSEISTTDEVIKKLENMMREYDERKEE